MEGENKKRNLKLIIPAAVILLIVLIILVRILFPGNKTLIAEDYVSLDITGLSGEATASLVFDYDALYADISGDDALTEREKEEIQTTLNDAAKDFSISPAQDLKNGDSVEVKSGMEKNILKSYKVVFTSEPKTIEISGLTEISNINLADYVTTEFSGFDGYGYGYVSIDYESLQNDVSEIIRAVDDSQTAENYINEELGSCLYGISISPSYFEGLKNADEITSAITTGQTEISEYGVRFETGEITAEADGLAAVETFALSEYITCSVTGYEGIGKASLSLDREKLIADMSETFEKDGRGVYGAATEDGITQTDLENAADTVEYAWENSFSNNIDKAQELSNGDVIEVSCTAEEGETCYISSLGILLEGFSQEITADGLKEIREISLAEYVNVNFSGFDGQGNASASLDEEALYNYAAELIREDDSSEEAEDFISRSLEDYIDEIDTELSQTENLSNEDSVTVSVQTNYPLIEDYGIRFLPAQYTAEAEDLVPTEEIVLTDYLSCSFSGYDGAGTAEISFDEEKLSQKLSARAKETGIELPEYLLEEIRDLWEYDCTTTITEGRFSNGDSVTITCSPDYDNLYDYLSEYGIYLSGGETQIEVSGLLQPEEIDLSEALSVTFSGNCPQVYAEVTVDWDQPYVSATSLANMGSTNIVAYNGDSFEGTIDYDADQLLEMGYTVTNNRYSFEISGLSSYDYSFGSLEDAALAPFLQEGETRALSTLGSESQWLLDNLNAGQGWFVWDETSITLLSAVKDYNESSGGYNDLILNYRAVLQLKPLDRQAVEKEVYFEIRFTNLLEDTSGEITYDSTENYLFVTEEEAAAWREQCAESFGEGVAVSELENEAEEASAEAAEASGDEDEAEAQADESETASSESAAVTEALALLNVSAPEAADADSADAVLSYDGHTYLRFDKEMSWEAAEDFCESAGGHLATVTSLQEWYTVQSFLYDVPYSEYWIGASDKEDEGAWKWVTGESFEWTNWSGSQPDNDSGNADGMENYLTMGSKYQCAWNDASSDLSCGFVMEIDPETSLPEGIASITELTETSSQETWIQDSFQDPYGNTHFGSLKLDASNSAWITYQLDGKWSALAANLSTWGDCEGDASFEIAFWGDGELLYSVFDYNKTDAPLSFGVDLTGVQELTITAYNRGGYGNGFLFLNESVLLPAGEDSASETPAPIYRLSGLTLVDSSNYESKAGLCSDIYGNIHNGYTSLYASGGGSVFWNLNGEYAHFTGKLIVSGGAYSEQTSANVVISADGETLYEASAMDKFQGAQEFDIDLTGKQTLEITTSTGEDAGDIYVYIFDDALTK